ncbi:hypothetical protein GPECTOR_2g1533 [Gonium pectorale]|uniref:Peptidase M20 dimerisation domain-containing protein n=1 Tax=Gonium pectorale TaxID=33097 RepID=A0A150H1M1_GONPE|nr:hypothetical protein GPECTOR_2g1533 [Gonium pectorale]|eukprot:KXZ55981.1 hypothetical protein GPECTOR_2g1533 [Gonium pectorale]
MGSAFRLLTILLVGCLAAKLGYLYRHAKNASEIPSSPPAFGCPKLDEAAALGRFRRLITFPTVSNVSAPDHVANPQAFHDLLAALEESYPRVWQQLNVEAVGSGGLSRLITWAGSDPALPPILFVSHLDVVPVTPGTEDEWTHPPWSGALAGGFVWGRGSLDTKFSAAALLEAAEGALAAGWAPERTIMLAFGHDEEVGGALGAGAIAQLLRSRGVELEVVVDEGGVVLMDGLRPFSSGPVALVGTAEKGYVNLEVVVRSPGGHSAMPPIDGSSVASQLGRLLTALALLPAPSRLAAPVTDMLGALAPAAPAWMRLLLANCEQERSWLVNRLLAFAFRRLLSGETAAMVGDSLALTMLQSGVAYNVLPQEARLNFNVRLLPGSSPEAMLAHLRSAAGWAGVDAEVTAVKGMGWSASNVTSAQGPHFRALRRVIQETWRQEGKPPVLVVPFLLTGATDSRHYAALSRGGVLRFVPFGVNKAAGELGLLHATNERVRAQHFAAAVCAYTRAFQLMAGPPAPVAAGDAGVGVAGAAGAAGEGSA